MKIINDNELFRPRLVVFLDILGFGKMVYDASGSADLEKYKKIDVALERIQSISDPLGANAVPHLEVNIFSDSVILTVPPEKDTINALFSALSRLMWDLMKLGVWVRGGVSVGKHSRNPQRPWGPAIIDAYRIENEIASFPRIALGAKALKLTSELGLLNSMSRISRDGDGVYSIDSIHFILGLIASKDETSPPETDILIIRDQLEIAHDGAVENPSVYKKINKLCAQWDSYFEPLKCKLNRDYRTKSGKESSLLDTIEETLDF